jgi:AcrR family transcriptional regulator
VESDELRISSLVILGGGRNPMNAQLKTKPDDTRGRIMDVADRLFRQLGFAKTTVADIASELGMSPANVYRFFPSKNAIVEAICRRCLGELDERAWAIARSRGPAAARIERLVLEIFAYHKENLLTDKRVNDIVLVAIEDSWDAIQHHKDVIRNVVELILRDGIEAGEFQKVDPAETSRLLMRSVVAFVHPVLISQCLADEKNVEAEAQATIRFVLRAITPRT